MSKEKFLGAIVLEKTRPSFLIQRGSIDLNHISNTNLDKDLKQSIIQNIDNIKRYFPTGGRKKNTISKKRNFCYRFY